MSETNQIKYRKFYILALCVCWIFIFMIGESHRHEAFGDTQISKSSEKFGDAQPVPKTKTKGHEAGDILSIMNPEPPSTLNPHLTTNQKDWEASRITLEPLASADKDGIVIPFLAAEIPTQENGGISSDGKSVIWKLKKGVKWSDGKPFTAEDVLFTYQFIMNPKVKSLSAPYYDDISNVEIIDPYTVKVNYKDVVWNLPFTGPKGAIIPRHIFESYNGANAGEAPANRLPVGTGAYRVVPPGIKPQEVLLLGTQIIETNKILFEPNPFFREERKPYFRRVEYRGGGTPKEAARLVLKEGKADYAYTKGTLAPELLEKMAQGGQGRLLIDFGSKVQRIALNRTDPNKVTEDGDRSSLKFPHPFFSDKRVRQAFAYAVDRKAIAELYSFSGKPTNNVLVSPTKYNSPNSFYEFNPEKASKLLDEAGWIDHDGDGIRDKNGVKMKVVYQAYLGATIQKTQQIIKKTLESIGVQVDIKIVDPSIMIGPGAAHPDSYYRFNADMLEFIMFNSAPEPLSHMRFYTCNLIPQKSNNWTGLNIARFCNPEYEALIKEASTELNPEKRQQLLIKMNDFIVEDVVMIPLIHLSLVEGVNRNIEGVDRTPWDSSTWNIKDWRRIIQ